MPPRRSAGPLQQLCAARLGRQVVQLLLGIERAAVELQRRHNAGQQVETAVARLTERYNGLVRHLAACPAQLLHQITEAVLQVYNKHFEGLDKGLGVWVLTKGVTAREFYEATLPTNTIDFDMKPSKVHQIDIPILVSVLRVVTQPRLTKLCFNQLTRLGAVSENVLTEFKAFLSSSLPALPNLRSLTLSSHNSTNSLPQCSNDHLQLVGAHCPELEFLDVSFNKAINGEGLKSLAPDLETGRPGCVKLKKLYLFDCGVFEKEVARLVPSLPVLTYLGYKETGKVLKTIHKDIQTDQQPFRELNLTHVDNLGSKARRLIASALRCKKPVALAIAVLCPRVQNLKLRVCDDDVANLSCLSRLETVEFVYHVGSIGSPGPHTAAFLGVRGAGLSSVALICNTMTMTMLTSVAECCPGLTQLWSRSNHLMAPHEEESANRTHTYLTNLKILYLRVGEGELSVSSIPEYVLPFLLRNARGLRELILAVRSSLVNDCYVHRLVMQCQLFSLQKVLLVVPGLNSLPGILKLRIHTVHSLMHLCPDLRKLGNILSWDVTPEEVAEVEQIVTEMNYDLEIVNRKMTIR